MQDSALHRGSKKAGNMIVEKIGEYRREIGQRRIGQWGRVGHPPNWMNFYVSRSVCAGPIVAPLCCASIVATLRCATACGARKGFFSHFTARLKSCPDTCSPSGCGMVRCEENQMRCG